MKKVEKFSLLFGLAILACGVVGSVSVATTETEEEVPVEMICGESGVTEEVTLNSERTEGVCVEAGTQGVILTVDGDYAVEEGTAIKIGKGAEVTLKGEGTITGAEGVAEIYNNGNLTIGGGVKIGKEGTTVVNHGSLTVEGGEIAGVVENGYAGEDEYAEGVNEAEPALTVNGGTLNGVKNAQSGVLVVNGGALARAQGAVVENAGKAVIKGGKFTGEYVLEGSGVITGGEFETTVGLATEGADVKVAGGVFNQGGADLRLATVRARTGNTVLMREDGKFILGEVAGIEAGDLKIQQGQTVSVAQEGEYTYEVADSRIATVDGAGVVTGRNVGATKVTIASKLAVFSEQTDSYQPVTKTVSVVVYQVVGDDKAQGRDGEEVTIMFEEDMEVVASSAAHLTVERLSDDGVNTATKNILSRVSNYKEGYDISYVLEDGNVLPVKGQKMKIYLKLSDDLMRQNYGYYQVMYVKDDGSIGEVLHAQIEDAPNGEKQLAFETTHLSTYAVRASNKPFTGGNETVETPAAGVMTQEETEGGSMGWGVVVAGAAVLAVAGASGVVLRKRMAMRRVEE